MGLFSGPGPSSGETRGVPIENKAPTTPATVFFCGFDIAMRNYPLFFVMGLLLVLSALIPLNPTSGPLYCSVMAVLLPHFQTRTGCRHHGVIGAARFVRSIVPGILSWPLLAFPFLIFGSLAQMALLEMAPLNTVSLGHAMLVGLIAAFCGVLPGSVLFFGALAENETVSRALRHARRGLVRHPVLSIVPPLPFVVTLYMVDLVLPTMASGVMTFLLPPFFLGILVSQYHHITELIRPVDEAVPSEVPAEKALEESSVVTAFVGMLMIPCYLYILIANPDIIEKIDQRLRPLGDPRTTWRVGSPPMVQEVPEPARPFAKSVLLTGGQLVGRHELLIHLPTTFLKWSRLALAALQRNDGSLDMDTVKKQAFFYINTRHDGDIEIDKSSLKKQRYFDAARKACQTRWANAIP